MCPGRNKEKSVEKQIVAKPEDTISKETKAKLHIDNSKQKLSSTTLVNTGGFVCLVGVGGYAMTLFYKGIFLQEAKILPLLVFFIFVVVMICRIIM